jgi:hypothetical protein
MPFAPVDGKNFSEVAQGLEHYLSLLEKAAQVLPEFNGWDFAHYRAAAVTMVGEASDSAYEDLHGLLDAKLDERLKHVELILGRMDEQIQALGGPAASRSP